MGAINQTVLDTEFRSALRRLSAAGRIKTIEREIDTHLEAAAYLKALDGTAALLMPRLRGHDIPMIGNVLCCQENCEAAFGVDYQGIRQLVARALGNPISPQLVTKVPCQEHIHTENFDIGAMLPVLQHTAADSGRFITSGVVVVRDPETGVYNASYHRLQLLGPKKTAIKLDFGRHLRMAHERAIRMNMPLPIAVCIGTDMALQYTAATMGAQMPESMDELAVAGGLRGTALPVVKAVTQDLLVPAGTEIVLEGVIHPTDTVPEGPFAEFIGYLSPEGNAPVFEVTAVTHRTAPIYHGINGYGRETVVLRKYVLEASLLKSLQPAFPIVADVEMTAGGMHRFHAIIGIKKGSSQHDGFQRNIVLAAFATLKDLDMVIVVDDDINIRDPLDVEYALATRMEASRDLIVIPDARGHEYVRISRAGIRAKLGIDATVPFESRERFARAPFMKVDVDRSTLSDQVPSSLAWLRQAG